VDIWSWLAIFAIVKNNHMMMIQIEAGRGLCCRLTHVIPSVPIKDHIVVGPRSFFNAVSHLAGRISRSDHKA
jgi:hypothetical protein